MGSPSNHQRDVETDAIERKTAAFSLSPERLVKLKLGTLWAGASFVVGCVITCTVYVVRMEGKVSSTDETVKKINAYIERTAPEHSILWDWYDNNRTASRGTARLGSP